MLEMIHVGYPWNSKMRPRTEPPPPAAPVAAELLPATPPAEKVFAAEEKKVEKKARSWTATAWFWSLS